jgi:dUTP pyrophosphatase
VNICVLDPGLYEAELARGFVPAYPGDAGIDLRAREDTLVTAGTAFKIPLGVAIELHDQTRMGWLTGRSTTSLSMGCIVHEGKIDSGYTGEIHCFVTAQGSPVQIVRGDRICQLVVLAIEPARGWRVVSELKETSRGPKGLGSSGRR